MVWSNILQHDKHLRMYGENRTMFKLERQRTLNEVYLNVKNKKVIM